MEIGNLFIIAAPSGTGKTTLVRALVNGMPGLAVSISHTTRMKRPNEKNGLNYFFISEAEFRRMIEKGEFLEYATVFDAFYGTSALWVKETLQKGIDVVLEIDWQGMQQIKALIPSSISIFILPPSLDNLRARLVNRNQDKPQVIQNRLADVKETISHIHEFDYVVINDDFAEALSELKLLVQANRLLQRRQCERYTQLLTKLIADE
ncbi:MAG TPA: guanylate kinase [Gammaproteobacteria bacterium]|nr:guanylate kinase [Gammaproteobacteria bacterium]